jgi:hypothetical protein
MKIIELCLKANTTEPCGILLADIVKDVATPTGLRERFRDIYIPLIVQLKPMLATYGLLLSSPPFLETVQCIVQAYIASFTSTNPPPTGRPLIPKLGCANVACHECQRLDAFMQSTEVMQCEFRALQAVRQHIERQVSGVRNRLCTDQTSKTGSPRTLVITKTPVAIDLTLREERVKNPQAFLNIIGNQELKAILGEAGYNRIVVMIT